MRTRSMEILEREYIKTDVIKLRLSGLKKERLPIWQAGAHITLILGRGVERQYSLCGDEKNRDIWEIAVKIKHNGRGGSKYIENKYHAGRKIIVRDPINTFQLKPADNYLFFAGGIGITPIISMIRRVKNYGNKWCLVYSGKNRSYMPFVEETEAEAGHTIIQETELNGRIDIKKIVGGIKEKTSIYCCGPENFLQEVEKYGGQIANICSVYSERFAPAPKQYMKNKAFTVTVASTGECIEVDVEETIAEALERNGYDVLTSCREGTCGTCLTSVLEGVPEHRDSVLTEEEKKNNELIMICCSRALTKNITIDI